MKKTVEFTTRGTKGTKNNASRNAAITAPVTVPTNVMSSKAYEKKQKYDLVMNTRQYVGGKQFCYIPMELLEVDNSYQREYAIDEAKVTKLASEFDINMYDPIQVAPHPETHSFAIINGVHRYLACKILCTTGMEASIVTGLSADPEERRIQEATIFVTQSDLVDNLSITQKHKANILRKIPKYLVLEECIKNRNIIIDRKWFSRISKEEQDKYADHRVLSGYGAALNIAGLVNGKQILNTIFDIISITKWHDAPKGYSALILNTLSCMLRFHGCEDAVVKAIIDYFMPMEPAEFYARAYEKYPARADRERLALLLEDEVCSRLNIDRVYSGESMVSLLSGNNKEKIA